MSSGASGSDPQSPVPEAVRGAWARLSAYVGALPRPARILAVSTLLIALAVGLWLAVRSAYQPYGVLFSRLEREDAGAVVNKLKELKIPYRVTSEGSTIEVPEARVAETRLELASAGLPRGGGIGFEGFDNMRLGATEFEQKVLYRRAMEGELARTIGGLDAVRSARVHLVLPEKSVFATRREPASASVFVRLRGGRTLGATEISGVIHLVAAAVPGLSPDRIALVTTDGVPLHRPRSGAADAQGVASGDPDSPPARALESSLEEQTRTMLEPLVGPGHVQVRVSAEVDLSRFERTEDHYDKASAVLRSEEATREHAAPADDNNVAGVPGAQSNLPGTDGPAPGATGTPGAGAILRESHTRNFEVDHVQEKRVSTAGVVRRLAVAVVVDGVPGPDGKTLVPRGAPELDKLAKLVRASVGADDKRGDVVTVESVPFVDSDPTPVAAAPPPSFVSKLPQPVRKWGPIAGGAAAFLVALVALLARRSKKRKAQEEKEPLQLTTTPEPELLPETATPAEVRVEAVEQARLDPATAALVVRHWLGSSEEQEHKREAA
jgi:flagellar M-ring protein FliF